MEYICLGCFFFRPTSKKATPCVWVSIPNSSDCRASILATSLNAVGSARLIVNSFNVRFIVVLGSS